MERSRKMSLNRLKQMVATLDHGREKTLRLQHRVHGRMAMLDLVSIAAFRSGLPENLKH
jgi:hypothetical protein